MSAAAELSKQLRTESERLGFDAIGIAAAVSPPGYHRFLEWLASGYAADMTWLDTHRDAREHPSSVMSGTASVIMVALNYHEGTPHRDGGRVSRYAWGDADYHNLMRPRLKELAEVIHKSSPGARTRAVVDTAPLMERDFGRLAGIGWVGKNTMLISRRIGSWFFLGAILTDVVLECDETFESDHCGTCTRCLDACPTHAFPEPHVLDASRCISYLTIERRRDPIPSELRDGMGQWLFGCDICQDVCPWNRFAPQASDPSLQPRADSNPIDCRELLRLSEPDFLRRFRGTPLLRSGRAGLLRNAAIVLGNMRCGEAAAELTAALQDGEPLIRGAAAWALGRLPSDCSRTALRQRLHEETDAQVQQEIRDALQALDFQGLADQPG